MEFIQDYSLERLMHEVLKLQHLEKKDKLENLELYRGQPPILFTLSEKDGRTQKEIAEIMKNQPATITKTIQRMEKSGFLERRSDSKDKRVMRVYLTQKGKDVIPQVKEILDEIETKMFSNLSIEEKIILKRIFIQVYNNLNV